MAIGPSSPLTTRSTIRNLPAVFRRSITKEACALLTGFLLIAGFLSCGTVANAQARQEVKYNMVLPQLTISYQHIDEDYQFLESNGSLKRVVLNGIAVEHAYRRFYPVEIIARASYAAGNPSVRS